MANEKGVIQEIQILGNERINKSIINNYLTIKANDIYDVEKVNENLKILYKTEFFKNIIVDYKDNILYITVEENPLIIEVLFDGNDKIEDNILLSEISTTKRSVLNKNKIANDTKRILDIYRRTGRFLATVTPKIIEEKGNRAKIVFEIYEGKQAKIRKIFFVGNAIYSTKTLKEEIQSKESKVLRFSSDEIYDPLRLELDKELLRKFYYSKGYPDFEVLSAVGEVDRDFKWFDITFLINEGEKYTFGDIEVTNNIDKIDTNQIRKNVLIKTGKVFNNNLITSTIDKITNELSKSGYMFVDMQPAIKKNEEEKTIDINFIIKESARYYVGEININGNTRTFDHVIRKELRVDEGDAFNSTKFSRSIQRIQNLGYFSKVDYQQAIGKEPNQIDIDINVEEKKTGELTLGAGYSTIDGANVNFGIQENNLLGLGQSLGLNVLYSEYTKSTSLNYGKSNFLDLDLYASMNVYYKKYEDEYNINYTNTIYGTGVNGSYSITEYLGQRLFYSIENEKIGDVDYDYYGIIMPGEELSSIIGQSLYYDRVDSRFDPTSGFYTSWTLQYAGLGGDKKYIKNTGSIDVYIPVIPSYLTLKLNTRGGMIDGVKGQKITPSDGFYLGGTSLRGFKYGGLGPRTYYRGSNNPKNGSSVGGKRYYVYDAELKFPLGLPKEYGVYGSFFYNAGTVTGVEKDYRNRVADSGSIRAAYGFSILWNSPMGPISFDFSKISKQEDYDETQNFAFNFGTTF